jgi:hypothetical protein
MTANLTEMTSMGIWKRNTTEITDRERITISATVVKEIITKNHSRTWKSERSGDSGSRSLFFYSPLLNHPASRRTSSLIPRNGDPAWNVIEESDPRSAKRARPKTVTNGGRMIFIKPVWRNAPASIRENLDPDSNPTEESGPHAAKHFLPNCSIDAERMISSNQVLKNAQFWP